jgi:hypothetical protein
MSQDDAKAAYVAFCTPLLGWIDLN